jgi:hypothetical protein
MHRRRAIELPIHPDGSADLLAVLISNSLPCQPSCAHESSRREARRR